MSPKLPMTALALALCSSALLSQSFVDDPAPDTGFYFHGTLKTGSPTFPGTDTAAKLVRTGAPITPSQVQLTPAALGLPSTVEILAVSHGDDVFGEWSIYQGGVNGRHHRIEYTVNPSASGSNYKKYRVYGYDYENLCFNPAAPGAASLCNSPITTGPFVVDNATSPSTSDDLEGLAHDQVALLPIYYTVSNASVSAIRGLGGSLAGFNSCDILTSYVDAQGIVQVAIAMTGVSLGLNSNDVIDALAAMWNGAGILGLAPTSPSVVNGAQIGIAPYTTTAYGNYLYSFVPSASSAFCAAPPAGFHFNTLNIWATATDLGLHPVGVGSNPVNSDCRGDVRVADPSEALAVNESLPLRVRNQPPGNNYISRRSFSINNLDGNVFGMVQVALGSTFTLDLNLTNSTTFAPVTWALFRTPGALDNVPPAMWTNSEVVPLNPPAGANPSITNMPFHLSETFNGSWTGTTAITGNSPINPTKFPRGYTNGQQPAGTQTLSLALTAPPTRRDEMFVLVAYVLLPGASIPIPVRSAVVTVLYRNRAAGTWPTP